MALEVRDSGCGMSEDTLKKIFDPFFSTKSQGRGLAMAAAQGFARTNQGDIQVVSVPGEGTLVRLCLPAAGRNPAASGHGDSL